MQHAFGMDVPESVAEMCQPPRVAVLVYDAQVGILPHVRDWALVLTQIRSVVEAARGAGVPVLYVRHVSVPPSHMGVGALRTAMAWQRVERAEDVQSSFPHDAIHTQLVDELKPEAGEPVFDKLGMSAFVGTPLEVVLRAPSPTRRAAGRPRSSARPLTGAAVPSPGVRRRSRRLPAQTRRASPRDDPTPGRRRRASSWRRLGT